MESTYQMLQFKRINFMPNSNHLQNKIIYKFSALKHTIIKFLSKPMQNITSKITNFLLDFYKIQMNFISISEMNYIKWIIYIMVYLLFPNVLSCIWWTPLIPNFQSSTVSSDSVTVYYKLKNNECDHYSIFVFIYQD